MKKRLGVAALAAAAGCAVIFSGCAGCSGCGANGKTNEAAFSSNWYADTSYRYIQPMFTGEENAEILKYGVTVDSSSAANTSYSVEYSGGSYTTAFYATTLDKSLIDKDYRDDYPDNLTVYYYKTELSFDSVTFKLKTDASAVRAFNEDERTETECYFMSVDKALYPIYSKITTNCHSPAELQIGHIDYAYKHVEQTVTTSYKYDGTAAKTVVEDELDSTNNAVMTVDGLDKTDNSLIDVCGLNIGVRAMQLSESLSQVISVYSPAGGMQNYTFAGSSSALGEDERKSFEGILSDDNFKLFYAGEGKSLKTVCVTATLNSDMTGVSQKYWFAAIDNAKNNKGRATMVKMSTPLPFSLGTLNYSLTKITSTLYNG